MWMTPLWWLWVFWVFSISSHGARVQQESVSYPIAVEDSILMSRSDSSVIHTPRAFH